MKSLIFILLLVVCVRCFDYFMFVQLWPGSWIYEGKVKYNFTNDFVSIHGIWAQNYNGTWPQFCNNKTIFNPNVLANISDNLTKYWTNFVNATEFWQHEFSKHMVCATNIYPDPYKFFYTGLALREKYNVYQLFASHDIYPSNDMKYDLNKLYFVIKQEFGINVVITCEPNTILNEIRFCIDKNFSLFDCPKNLYKDQCRSQSIWYNKINY